MRDIDIRSLWFIQAAQRVRKSLIEGRCGYTLQERIEINNLPEFEKKVFLSAVEVYCSNETNQNLIKSFIKLIHPNLISIRIPQSTLFGFGLILAKVKEFILRSDPLKAA